MRQEVLLFRTFNFTVTFTIVEKKVVVEGKQYKCGGGGGRERTKKKRNNRPL